MYVIHLNAPDRNKLNNYYLLQLTVHKTKHWFHGMLYNQELKWPAIEP